MRIAIIGIGGVGGYFGGKLALAYASTGAPEIIFIARGAHLKAIQQNGLHLLTKDGDYVVWPNVATDDPDLAGSFDLVFFCVKSYELEYSAHQFKGNIKKNTVVIPVLNGIDSSSRLQGILPHANVLSGSVFIISHIEQPGIIRQEGGACKLTFGTDDKTTARDCTYILDILTAAGINAVLTDKISETLWMKFLLMCPLASLSCATGKTYGEIWADNTLRKKTRDLMMEVSAVAAARHVILTEETIETTMETIGRFGYHSKTSMLLDMEKGNQTEIDTLTAFLCRVGRETGIPTPLHDEILQQLSP